MVIKSGDKIKVEYEGSLDDGTVFDSSLKHGQALEFTIGQNQVIPGFENSVIGMKKGEEKQIKIQSKEAYGEIKKELIQKIPKDQLPKEMDFKKGMVLGIKTPDGRQIPVPIADVSKNDITLDLNHPLAGKNLNFKIKILEIINNSK